MTLQLHYRAASIMTLQLHYRASWYKAPWYHPLTLTHFLCLMRRRYFCMVMPTCTSTARWCNSCICSDVTANTHTHTHTHTHTYTHTHTPHAHTHTHTHTHHTHRVQLVNLNEVVHTEAVWHAYTCLFFTTHLMVGTAKQMQIQDHSDKHFHLKFIKTFKTFFLIFLFKNNSDKLFTFN